MLSHHDKMDENSSMMHYSKVDVFFGGYFSGYWLSHVDAFALPSLEGIFSKKIGLIAEIWTLSSPNFKMSVGFIQVLKPLITPETARDSEIWI